MIRVFVITFVCGLSVDSIGQDQFVSTPLERGLIRGGQRAGVWQYYDTPGELGLEINYETMEVLQMKSDTSKYVVKEANRWVNQKLRYPCRPHGSIMPLFEHYRLKVRAHNELFNRADRKNEPVETVLTFEVGADGVSSNPNIWGYKKFGMEEMIKEAYESAPNVWIPGVKMDGSVATCRFGIYVRICPNKCPEFISSDTVRMLYGGSNTKEEISAERNPVTSEPAGMALSPDGEWIAMSAKIMANTGGEGFFVISTRNGTQKRIQYGTIQGMHWLNNENIAFKYYYSLSGIWHGEYNLTTELVKSRNDSLIFFERISPDHKSLLGGKERNGFLEVVKVSLTTGTSEWVAKHPDGDMFPVSWSPDNLACVMKGRRGGIDNLYHFDVRTTKLTELPLIDAEPCGWSTDGQIFLQRVIPVSFGFPPVASLNGQIFAVDSKTNVLSEVTKKMDNFITAEFSPGANKFLLLRKKNLSLFSLAEKGDPKKIASNVSYAVWSSDGRQIAYVSEMGTLLSIYDLQTNRSRIVLNTAKR